MAHVLQARSVQSQLTGCTGVFVQRIVLSYSERVTKAMVSHLVGFSMCTCITKVQGSQVADRQGVEPGSPIVSYSSSIGQIGLPDACHPDHPAV
jgi:hypothetical protein